MARLEEICSLITDGSHFSPEDEGVGYPMFSVKDMTPNGFNISGCKKIGEEAYKKLVANGCKPLNDDVVVAKDGSYLKTAFVIKGNPEIALLSSIAILRPKIDLVVPEYLSYFLKSDAVYRTVSLNYITGTALKRIILKGIRKIEVDLPDIGEQEQRAQRLSKVDYLCQLRKQQLAKLDELVKARFVEMFENSSWPNTSLNDICSEIVDCPHSTPKYEGNLEHPAIRTTEIKKGYIDWDSMKYVSEEEYQKRIKSLKPVPGDIVYGREGTYGNAAIIPDGYEFCLGQRVMLFRPNKTKCISAYVLYAILSDHVKRQADEKNVGATVPHVNVADAKQFDVVLPPLSIQNQFAAFVERVDQQKQTVQKSLEKLELMKKALMQEYFG